MEKMFLAYLVVAMTSSAMAALSPVYERIRMIDEVVEAMAEFKEVDSEELLVNNITFKSAKVLSVTVLNVSCDVQITKKPLPPGMAGAAKISGEIVKSSCDDFSTEIPTASYEKISSQLQKAARLGKIVEVVQVSKTSKGKSRIKIISEK